MLHDGRISTLENQLKEFKKVNDFLVDKVAAQAKQISALYLKPPQLSWRINDVEKVLSQAREKKSTVLESSPFYSANNAGYKLKLCVYPNGDVTNKHNYLSLFLVIMEGEYDALLPWPFHQRITFILVDQKKRSDGKKNIVMESTTDPTLSSCAKPAAGKVVKPSIGFARFVTHKNLKTRGYIVNDSLLLQVEVHRGTKLMEPYRHSSQLKYVTEELTSSLKLIYFPVIDLTRLTNRNYCNFGVILFLRHLQ